MIEDDCDNRPSELDKFLLEQFTLTEVFPLSFSHENTLAIQIALSVPISSLHAAASDALL
jgi:hypothetical protein